MEALFLRDGFCIPRLMWLLHWRTKQRRISIVTLCCLLIFTAGDLFAQQRIAYLGLRTIEQPVVSVARFVPHFKDTILWDTVYQQRAANDLPVSYQRKIQASVCFDNKCRLLNIILHWNVTGRYLGFELPRGEYLSKAEHEPFVPAEYERMHAILSDPFSPLGRIEYNELVPAKASAPVDIDAVSSPTSRDLLEFVVEGAAYTTYKLWHIVHGPTRDSVSHFTEKAMNEELWLEVAECQNVADRVWALARRRLLEGASNRVREAILRSIRNENYNVAESAVRAVTKEDLLVPGFPVQLLGTFDHVGHSLKKPIVMKFSEIPQLDAETIGALGGRLGETSADLSVAILALLSDKQVQNDELNSRVVALMQNPNYFVARQAYDFLCKAGAVDTEIMLRINEFRKKHNLK